MITVHGIPNCDTVKKARAWLDDQGVAYRFRDFKRQPPAQEELARWANAVGWEALLNRRGTTFRALSDDDKQDIDCARALHLMVAQPSLIKRPVVEDRAGKVTVGFSDVTFAVDWGP